jgi:hypothetical protein
VDEKRRARRLARTGRIVSMEFISFPEEEEELLEKYLESLPLEELKHQGLTATQDLPSA